MTWPKGLAWNDRIATDGEAWYFDCQREGHKRTRLRRRSKRLIEDARTKHDAQFHVGLPGGETERAVTLGELADEFLAWVEGGDSDLAPESVRFYTGLVPEVVEAIGASRPAASIRQIDVVRAVIEWRKTSSSKGNRIKKRLTTLRRLQRWAGIPIQWTVPDTVERMLEKPEAKRPARVYTEEELDRLDAALPPGSLERAVFRTKRLTVFRDVELRALRVTNVDLETRTFHYTLRAKRREYAHAFPIAPALVEELRPHVEGKDPEAFVFSLDPSGRRPLHYLSLRHRFLMASKRATPPLDPPIELLGQIRHRTITILVDCLGPYEAQKATGHRSVKTTEGYVRRPALDTAATKAATILAKVTAGVTPRSPDRSRSSPVAAKRARSSRKR